MKIDNLFQLMGIALTISPLLSLPAQAGYNGQQLEITSFAATEIRVTGTNQNGETVTWTASGNGEKENRTFRTDNWWWHGNVTIVVIKGESSPDQCNINVPQISPDNWFSVNCGAWLLIR
jgi:hypothetical protein